MKPKYLALSFAILMCACNKAQVDPALQVDSAHRVSPLAVPCTSTEGSYSAEFQRSNYQGGRRPLPVASTFNTGTYLYSSIPLYTPAEQLNLIQSGAPLIPSFAMPTPNDYTTLYPGGIWNYDPIYYDSAITAAKSQCLPITLIATQWEQLLSLSANINDGFHNSPAYTPVLVDSNGNIVSGTNSDPRNRSISMFGANWFWAEAGMKWAESSGMQSLVNAYPDPPLVQIFFNNEQPYLEPSQMRMDKRFSLVFPQDPGDEVIRKYWADTYIARQHTFQEAFRNSLPNGWKNKVIFVGFNAFGTGAAGRYQGWYEESHAYHGSLTSNGPTTLIADAALGAWDGGAPAYYLYNLKNFPSSEHTSYASFPLKDLKELTDFRLVSPQIESMQWPFMLTQAQTLNSNFRLNLITWNGDVGNSHTTEDASFPHYLAYWQGYSPQRYMGYLQFGAWINRPREIMQYSDDTVGIAHTCKWMNTVSSVVNRIYNTPELADFWKNGELVPNAARSNPWTIAPASEWSAQTRWFLLETDANQYTDFNDVWSEIPVYALALTRGQGLNKQWLIYAHSPRIDRTNVRISVPGWQSTQPTTDGMISLPSVNVGGSFYILNQGNSSVSGVVPQGDYVSNSCNINPSY